MSDSQRLETEWEGLRLVVESRPEQHWQAFVYDPANCEVVYAAQRITIDDAKSAAVEFAIGYRFGFKSDLKRGIISGLLVWNFVDGTKNNVDLN